MYYCVLGDTPVTDTYFLVRGDSAPLALHLGETDATVLGLFLQLGEIDKGLLGLMRKFNLRLLLFLYSC